MKEPQARRDEAKPVPRDERASRHRAARRQAERRHAVVVAEWLRRLERESGPAPQVTFPGPAYATATSSSTSRFHSGLSSRHPSSVRSRFQ